MSEPMSQRPSQHPDVDVETAARGLDPQKIVRAEQDAVSRALGGDRPRDAVDRIEGLLDMEERVLLDLARRNVPDSEEEIDSVTTSERRLIGAMDAGASTQSIRGMFDDHVRRSAPLFDALWAYLDESGQQATAEALEEARLSREESAQETRRPPGA